MDTEIPESSQPETQEARMEQEGDMPSEQGEGNFTPQKAPESSAKQSGQDVGGSASKAELYLGEPQNHDVSNSKQEEPDRDIGNSQLQHSNSKAEGNQPGFWFETSLNGQEMDFIHRLLPKGYSLTTQFRASRPRAARNIDMSQVIEPKDEPLAKRPPRLQSSRIGASVISYGPPKYSKNVSDLVKKCFKVLSQLQKHQYSWPFLKPVDPQAEGIPDYFDIVKEPMDLSKVDKRLRSGSYSNPMQFAADVRKIWYNATLYNPRKSDIYHMTIKISNFFEQLYKSVEENPFSDPPNEYVQNRVNKIEQKLDEIKNGYGNPEEYLSKPMSLEDKKKLALALRCSF